MRKTVFIEILLLCLFTANAVAEDTHEFVLDNGLKVLVREDHRAPVVVSQVWYKVGSSYEHDGFTGVSHALEHMMFKGTSNHPAGEFSRIISANGGNENAFTSADYTVYFQTLEKSRLPISFELEADRMQNLLLPEDEFKKEIEVVKEERRWRTDDDPQSFTYEVVMATAYQTSPYRQPVIGWMKDLDSMTDADLEAWYQQWYSPGNATLVVVGDVDPDEVLALAQKYFEPVPRRDIAHEDIREEVAQHGLKRVTVKRPAELPYLIMAYKTPTLKTAIENPDQVAEWETYALEVLSGILDGGNSARFESDLVRGNEVAASINLSYRLVSRLDNVLTIGGVPADGHTIDDLEQAIRTEIEAVQTTPVTEEELARVKAQVIANDIYQRDSIFYRGMILGIFESVGLPWQMADEYVEKVKAVTADQVRQVARKYLVDDGLTVGVLDPLPLDQASRRPSMTGDTEHVR